MKAGDAESLCYALKDTVRAEYERFYQMVNDGRLSEFQVKEFNMIYNSLCQESIGKEIENHVIQLEEIMLNGIDEKEVKQFRNTISKMTLNLVKESKNG